VALEIQNTIGLYRMSMAELDGNSTRVTHRSGRDNPASLERSAPSRIVGEDDSFEPSSFALGLSRLMGVTPVVEEDPVPPPVESPEPQEPAGPDGSRVSSGRPSLGASNAPVNAGEPVHSGSPPAPKADERKDEPQVIVTPFGIITGVHREGISTGGSGIVDEWRDFFMTHSPTEWIQNLATRDRFEALYGAKALVTLDYSGTIPENVNPAWVTSVAVDEDGKPLPHPVAVTEVTT